MRIINTSLEIGAEKPFEIIHLSDTHLTYADARDSERKVILAKERLSAFPEATECLNRACELSKEKGAPIIHTGDLMDFVSVLNIETVNRFTDENDCFMAAGNHEFSLYLGEEKEDAAYRNRSLHSVQKAFKNNIRMSSRVINGINFVALDNGYYLFEKEQFDFLKDEAKKGLPVVLAFHTPLFDKKLYDICMSKWDNAYLAGVPEELMVCYPHDRYEQQLPDELTLETIAYISDEPNIKAILTGHLHFTYEGTFAVRIPQIVNSCTDIRIIKIT